MVTSFWFLPVELNSSKKPSKKSAYKKSWENGGKAKKNWKANK